MHGTHNGCGDDDPALLEFLEQLLTSEGITVTISDHTGDVAELIRQVLPKVVALDLQTPQDRRAGLHVLERLRAEPVTALIPVLLLTADHAALRHHAADLLELGAIPVRKPFDVDHMLGLIQHAAVAVEDSPGAALTPALYSIYLNHD